MKFGETAHELAAFLIPLGVRLIPEAFSYPYPVGFDTIAYYIPVMISRVALIGGPVNYLGGTILLYAPLTYAALLFGNALMVMKFIPAILLGLLGWSAYQFGRKLLRWNNRKTLFLALLASLYFVTLRLSWDLHRNVLGLALVLLTLAFLSEEEPFRKILGVSVFATLGVMVHESSEVLIAIVAIVHLFSNGRYRSLKEWAPFLPAGLFAVFQMVSGRGLGAQLRGIEAVPNSQVSFTFIYNLGFLLFAFGFLIPVALIGLKLGIDRRLAIWAIVSLFFGLVPSLSGQTGAPYRWTMLLVIPIIVLFVQGINVLNSFERGTIRGLGRIATALSLVTIVVVSSGYVGLHGTLQDYFRLAPDYRYLMPLSMVESAISLSDVPSVIAIARWGNATLTHAAIMILPFQVYGWYLSAFSQFESTTLQPLDQTRNLDDIISEIRPRTGPDIVYARTVDLYIPNDRFGLVAQAMEAASRGTASIFVVWWEPASQGDTFGHLPNNFVPVFASGRLVVFMLS